MKNRRRAMVAHIIGLLTVMLFVFAPLRTSAEQVSKEETETNDFVATSLDLEELVSVDDMAGLLSDQEYDELYELAKQIAQKYYTDIRLVTTDDTEGKSSRDFTDDFFESKTKTYDGACCCIDMDNRELYLTTEGSMILYLNDNRIGRLLDNSFVYIASGDYAGTFRSILSDIDKYMEEGIEPNTVVVTEDGSLLPAEAQQESEISGEAIIDKDSIKEDASSGQEDVNQQKESEKQEKPPQVEQTEKQKVDSEKSKVSENFCQADGCRKIGTHSITGISGQTEWYCDDHYREILDILDMMEKDVGKGSSSKHICEAGGCTKEGTHSIIGFSGQTEYYCSEHYQEMEAIISMMIGE